MSNLGNRTGGLGTTETSGSRMGQTMTNLAGTTIRTDGSGGSSRDNMGQTMTNMGQTHDGSGMYAASSYAEAMA